MDPPRPLAHWPPGGLAHGRCWQEMRPWRERGWGVSPLPSSPGCLGSAHSWAPSVAPSLSGARFPPSTLPASGGNSHPGSYSQRLQHYLGFPVPCPRNLYVASPSSSFAMETRENSFSYLILGDTLLTYYFPKQTHI